MENLILLGVLVATSLLSLLLLTRHFKRDMTRLEKAAGVLLLLVPMVGPLLYWFLLTDTPPQDRLLQNRGGRGSYANSWVSVKPVLEKIIREREKSLVAKEPHDKEGAA